MSAAAAPEWLLRPEVGLCPCGCIGRRRKQGFLEKTIVDGADVMRRALFSDEVAARPGLLQAIEPRVKLVTVLALLLAAAFARHLAVLAGLYVMTSALAARSGLGLSYFARRVWLFVPVFTGIVVLPAACNLITPGPIVVPLGTWFGHPVGLTRPGLGAAALIVTRVAVSISLVVLLTLTTRWNRLLAALRALLVPRLFVQVLAMTYRYLFHLVTAIGEMYTARRARTVHRETSTVRGRTFVAATAGALFGKAHALADEVHLAMVARGYTGTIRQLRAPRPRFVDAVWTLAVGLAVVVAIGGDHALGM